MQKLVTIYLDSLIYAKGFTGTTTNKHGGVEEHLSNYLAEGWRIVTISAMGGGGEAYSRGWVAVLLEKEQ